MNYRKSVLFFALVVNAVIAAPRPQFDLREVKQILNLVDPKTCGCRPREHCEVPVPGAEAIGFRCGGHGIMPCCSRRRFPSLAKADREMPDRMIEEVTPHLNLPSHLKKAIAGMGQATDINIKLVTPLNNVEKMASSKNKLSATKEEKTTENKQDERMSCACVQPSECPLEKQHFFFGHSCGFGTVKCCKRIVEEKEEENEKEENNEEEEEAVAVLKDRSESNWHWNLEIPKVSLPFSVLPLERDIKIENHKLLDKVEEVSVDDITLNETEGDDHLDDQELEDRSGEQGEPLDNEEQEKLHKFYTGNDQLNNQEMPLATEVGKVQESPSPQVISQEQVMLQQQKEHLAYINHVRRMAELRRIQKQRQQEQSIFGRLTSAMDQAQKTVASYFYG